MATIIFDLDGTLIDSSKLVLPAYREAIQHVASVPVPSEETMKQTFGMPDRQIWVTLMPDATPEQRMAALTYTEHLVAKNIFQEDILLPHAREVLSELHRRGHVLTVASNCGTQYLDAVLDGQRIRKFFTAPLCLGSVNGRKKADILERHFQRFAKENAVMVGDRQSDVEAAAAHGIPCIGCGFVGFGKAEELQGAVHIIRSLPELLELFPEGTSTLLLPRDSG
jgi:phosphoglycolate phosphatase